ncbi:MAG: ankyrin repeat domain-containing protein [Mycobacterium sp.]
MASSLPDNPSLDRLLEEVRGLQPGITTDDAQLTVARGYGFTDWPALVHYLEIAADLSVDPNGVDETTLTAADRFCLLSSLSYNHTDAPPRREAAADLLGADPASARRTVWAAAAAADPAALSHHLADRRDLATARGGPFGWQPLLYLCYSRVSLNRTEDEVLSAATQLIDAGADPNSGYLWCGMSTPFTALTGVFGEGEQGPRRQPRHPFVSALAELLLERGAHPVDHQTLYNRMFGPDDSHLNLLFRYGLADAGPSPWERRLGEAMETRAQMWQRQVDWAAEHGFASRLALLERHGVDVTGARLVVPALPEDPNTRDENGATALHHAAWAGDLELIRQLLDLGADPRLTDRQFGTTPQGWAEHAYQTEAADLLRTYSSTI